MVGLVCNHKKAAGAGLEALGAAPAAPCPPPLRRDPLGAQSPFHTYLSSTSSQMTNRTAMSMWSRPRPKGLTALAECLKLFLPHSAQARSHASRLPCPSSGPEHPGYVHARAGSNARATGQDLVEFALTSQLCWDVVTCPLPPFSPQNLHDP